MKVSTSIKIYQNLSLSDIENLFYATLFHQIDNIKQILNTKSNDYYTKIVRLSQANNILLKYWQISQNTKTINDIPKQWQIKQDSLDFYNWLQKNKK